MIFFAVFFHLFSSLKRHDPRPVFRGMCARSLVFKHLAGRMSSELMRHGV